jgi:hypothetical protein
MALFCVLVYSVLHVPKNVEESGPFLCFITHCVLLSRICGHNKRPNRYLTGQTALFEAMYIFVHVGSIPWV